MAGSAAVRRMVLVLAETSTSRVSQRCLRMVSSARILTRAITNVRGMSSGIMVTAWVGLRSKWGSILAERLTSHQPASAPATCQSPQISARLM